MLRGMGGREWKKGRGGHQMAFRWGVFPLRTLILLSWSEMVCNNHGNCCYWQMQKKEKREGKNEVPWDGALGCIWREGGSFEGGKRNPPSCAFATKWNRFLVNVTSYGVSVQSTNTHTLPLCLTLQILTMASVFISSSNIGFMKWSLDVVAVFSFWNLFRTLPVKDAALETSIWCTLLILQKYQRGVEGSHSEGTKKTQSLFW